jgi:hypothetical protein
MAVKKVALFTTSDGKDFKDEVEANAHEKGLSESKSIEAYVEANKLIKAGAGMARKHIAGYLAFMDTYVPAADPVPAAAPAASPAQTQIPSGD